MHSAAGSCSCSRRRSSGVSCVALVVDLEQRHVGRADLLEHLADRGHAAVAVRGRRVDDVQHEIRVGHLLERRAKRRDERVRQPIDEADGVRHEQLAAVGQPHLADERIERDEQRVRRFRVRARQHVEQRRLAGVGVADERDRRHRRLVAPLAQLRAPLPHLLDVFGDRVDARADAPAIGLELRFAGAPRADAAAEPRQRGARADQPRQQVLQLRELDLQLAFARPRAPREDVEDQLRAVDDLAADRLFDLPQLRRRQLVVEDDDVDVQSRRTTPPAS